MISVYPLGSDEPLSQVLHPTHTVRNHLFEPREVASHSRLTSFGRSPHGVH